MAYFFIFYHPQWRLLWSSMPTDSHTSQQHADLQHAVFWLQQEVTWFKQDEGVITHVPIWRKQKLAFKSNWHFSVVCSNPRVPRDLRRLSWGRMGRRCYDGHPSAPLPRPVRHLLQRHLPHGQKASEGKNKQSREHRVVGSHPFTPIPVNRV